MVGGTATWPSGLLAAGLATAFTWAASRIETSLPFPPLSVASRIVRLVPGDVATASIELLGANALHLLAIGCVAGFVAVGAALPRLTARRGGPRVGGAAVAFGVLFAVAAMLDPVPGPAAWMALGAAASATLYATSLGWLLERTRGTDAGRRRALVAIGGTAAAVAVAGSVLGRLARRLAGPDTSVALRPPDRPAAALPRSPLPGIPGITPRVTRVEDHYVVDIDLLDPVVEARGWTLSVMGLVDRPLSLGFADLQSRFPLIEEHSVLTCISNPVGGPLVGSSRWTGVRLGEVLQASGLRADAVDVVFHCADGYSDSLPVQAALDPGVLLALGQEGRALTWEHGFPCRLRAPAVYGVKNVKWLERIEVSGSDHRGYWQRRGWSEEATVRTSSRIDAPTGIVAAGEEVWIAGVAWAGVRGIRAVEVSADGGRSWRPAVLEPTPAPQAWTRWAIRWGPPAPGRYVLACRATDGDGGLQVERERPPHPSGAEGYQRVDVEAR